MTYYFLSGKEAWLGHKEGDVEKIEKSGILDLAKRLNEMSSSRARLPHLRSDVAKLVSDFGAYIKKNKTGEREIKWRPTVLARVLAEARYIENSTQGFYKCISEALII
jgi:hypothetical protein